MGIHEPDDQATPNEIYILELEGQVERLTLERDDLFEKVCDECLEYENDGTLFTTYGWNENRAEGQIPCICISESGAYQVIEEERNNLREELIFIQAVASGENQCGAFDDTEAMLWIANRLKVFVPACNKENSDEV